MRVELITADEDLVGLGPAWTDLYRFTGTNNVFLTFDWVAALWQHCSGDDRAVVAVWEGATLVAVAPFAVMRAAGFRILGFIGCGLSNYEDVLAAPAQRDHALRAIIDVVQERGGWDVFRLKNMAMDSPNFAFFQALVQSPGARGLVRAEGAAPYIQLSGTWEAYWQRLGEFRRNSQWRARRLESELGPFHFMRAGSEGEVRRLLASLIALHRARHSRLDNDNVLEHPRGRDFYRNIAYLAFRSGKLDLVAMRVGSETAAVSMGLVQADRYFGLLTAFDERFRKYSPGRLLMFHLVESAYRRGLGEFDFCVGDPPYKLRYRPSLRRLASVFLYRRTLRGQLCRFWFGTALPVLRDRRLIIDTAKRLRGGVRRAKRTLKPDA